MEYIRYHGFIPKKEAINSGARIVGCSVQTATRYLDKITSQAGPLMVTRDMLRHEVLVLRTTQDSPHDQTHNPASHTQGDEYQ